MKHRRAAQGISVTAVGLALALAPLTASSASQDKAKSGSNPNSPLCKTLKSTAVASARLGTAIEKAVQSGNFSLAKRQLLSSMQIGAKAEATALSQLHSAPSKVQNAMKGLVKFENSLKSAIQKSTNMTNLESNLQKASTSAKAEAQSTTVSTYISAQCGSITTTT